MVAVNPEELAPCDVRAKYNLDVSQALSVTYTVAPGENNNTFVFTKERNRNPNITSTRRKAAFEISADPSNCGMTFADGDTSA